MYWIWIVIYYRGLKFPQRAVVFLPLEIDAACSHLITHFARKITVLLEAWSYKARCDREQDLWRYWLPERCIKQWYDKPTGHGWLQVVWAGAAIKQWHCYISYLDRALRHTVKTQDSKHHDSHHWPHSPLTKQIDFCLFYCVSGLWE